MTDQLTDEAVKALLDGTTPGPWAADGEPQNRIVWSPDGNRVCFMAHSSGLNDDRDLATSNLAAAAPALARALLDARAERDRLRADAQAAVALAYEAAADSLLEASVWCDSQERTDASWHNGVVDARKHHMARIRALAPADGLAAVEAMRADVKGWAENAVEAWRLMREAEAERDRLAAELAAAQQREAGLRVAIADMANSINVVGGDHDKAIKAIDGMVSLVKQRSRAALSHNGRGE